MGREKDRKLRRKRRRQWKLRKVKDELSKTTDLEERQRLIGKLLKISVAPSVDVPSQ